MSAEAGGTPNRGIMLRYMCLLAKNPMLTNAEAGELLGIDTRYACILKCKLRSMGYIKYTGTSPVEVLKKIPGTEVETVMENNEAVQYRNETIKEMVEVLMCDFTEVEAWRERIEVSREIRLLLELL